ncbi:MAG: hypothetical protein JW901_02165 [Dehalococcoidia bacterium]|nr:hypothetical protein [Dehalococcoidia bacterium]
MSENQKRVLQMLAEGKITVGEAQRLLSLVNPQDTGENKSGNTGRDARHLPRFIHIIVEPKPGVSYLEGDRRHHSKVNIRVPLSLIRAGIKFATLIPSDTAEHVDKAFKEKGFSFDIKKLKEEDIQEMLTSLENSEINVDNEREVVKIYSE